MQLIDTHSHIHMSGYKLDPVEELKAARGIGIKDVIVIGEAIEDSLKAVEFASENMIYTTVGVHPHTASGDKNDLVKIEELVKNRKTNRIVAIGECGLDYYYLYSPKADQKEVLIMQLDMATKYDLPVSFHVRGSKDNPVDAFDDLFEILTGYEGLRGVVHSYSGSLELAKDIFKRGLYVSLNGIITFSKDPETKEMVKQANLAKLMVETDAPFLTPEPYRGKINSPQYVVEVVKFIAEMKNVSVDVVAKQTTTNAKELFGI